VVRPAFSLAALLLFLTIFSPLKAVETNPTAQNYPTQIVPNAPIGFEVAALSPDTSKLATGAFDGSIQLWDHPTGRLIRTFARHAKKVTSIVFVANGSQILSASEDMTVKLWDAADGRLIKTITLNSPAEYWWDLQLSPDGTRAVSSQSLRGTDANGVVKLWDLASGKVIRSFRAYMARVAFTPDGKRLVTGGSSSDHKPNRQVLLWDVESGKLLQTFNGHPPFVTVSALAVSPDGTRILSHSAGDGSDVKLWDAASGRAIWTLSKADNVKALAFSPDGAKFLVFAAESDWQHSTVTMYETASGKALKTFKHERWGQIALFLPDGEHILTAAQQFVEIDTRTGRIEHVFGAKLNPMGSPIFSADGSSFISGGDAIIQWDVKTGRMLGRFPAPDAGTYTGFVSPALHQVIWALPDQRTKKLQDWQTGRILATFTSPGEKFGSATALSPDGTRVATVSYDKQLRIWDVATARVLRSFLHPDTIDAVAFSPDGSIVLTGDGNSNIRAFDVATGRPVWTFKGVADVEIVWSMKFSPDGTKLLAAIGQHGAKLLDAKTGRLIRAFDGHRPGYITGGAEFSADGSRILTSAHDETVKLWDVASGKMLRSLDAGAVAQPTFAPDGRHALLDHDVYNLDTGTREASFYSVNDNDWITITAEGYFTGSENSAATLSIVRGLDVFTIDQLYQSLSRADLVREKLAGDPRGLVREAAARLDLDKVLAAGDAPDVRLTLPGRSLGQAAGRSVTAEAEIIDRGGGVGRVEWRINGVTAGVDARVPAAAGQPARLSRDLLLDPGDNEIEVVAYNGANLLASIPARLNVDSQVTPVPVAPTPTQPAPTEPTVPAPVAVAQPRLFVLVAGVNDYADERIKLSYAVSDAKDVARAFNEASGNLYASAEIKLMTDADVNKDKLDAAFAEIAGKSEPTDVFVLYLAGHGKTVDGRYYFVPQDFVIDGDFTEKNIDAAVKTRAIAQEQWQQWFASIPARKSVILFDTCDSGTLTDDAETRQLQGSSANDRLSQATGRSILTASGGNQEALEGYRGHGLFTYELLDAINEADGDRTGTVEVKELAAYVYAQVSELSLKVFKQRQIPQMKITANYPLTRQTRILQDESVPVAATKPNFQLAQTAQLQIQPSAGGTVVRSLSAKTAVTVLESRDGWSLVAAGGKPLGYVATRDLAPIQ